MKRLLTILLVVCLAVAAVPAGGAAQENATTTATETPTATPTSTPTDSGNATGSNGEQPVQLYVEQPRHVSSTVDHSMSGGLHTYAVRGKVHEIEPSGFNASQVVRSGVREDSATLTYDKGIERWVLDTQGASGTYRVFWVVRTGGQTDTYAANIKVEQAEFAHLSPGRYEDLSDKASNWEWVITQFEDAGLIPSDASVEKVKSVVEDAVTWYEFYVSPLSALTGQFTSLGIMLVRWPAGWIIIGTLLLLFFWRDRKKTRQNRRYKRQFARIEDVDEAERRAEERELKRILSMKNFTDLGLSESDAEAIKEHCDAENPRQFLERLREFLSEKRMVGMLLAAHDQLGHRIRVRRDDLGNIEDVSLQEEPLPGEDGLAADGGTAAAGEGSESNISYLSPAEVDEEIILRLDWTDLSPEVLWDEHVDITDVPMPIANEADDEDDLVAEFDIPIGEDGHDYYILERREEFAELLITFIRHVAASEYTDDEGCIRADADIVDFLYTFTSVSAEKYRWPLYNTRDILLRCRQLLDADERMQDVAENSRQGGL